MKCLRFASLTVVAIVLLTPDFASADIIKIYGYDLDGSSSTQAGFSFSVRAFDAPSNTLNTTPTRPVYASQVVISPTVGLQEVIPVTQHIGADSDGSFLEIDMGAQRGPHLLLFSRSGEVPTAEALVSLNGSTRQHALHVVIPQASYAAPSPGHVTPGCGCNGPVVHYHVNCYRHRQKHCRRR